MRAYATAKPVNQPDPEPTDTGDSQVVVDLEAKRNGRKVH
jgi:hypothetical protein